MRATQEYAERKFDELNERCFEGGLPRVSIRMSRARTYLGQLGFKRRRKLWGKWEYYDFVLRISTRMDLPEQEVEDTLLHEMIHLYIAYHHLKDTSTHGQIFRKLMNDLNQRFDRHITVSHRKTQEELAQDTQRRAHLICVSTFRSGERGITIAAKSRVFRLWDVMPRFPEVTATEWVLSYDPYFNRYPRALTPKIYRIDQEILSAHLKDAQRLIRQGSRIVVARQAP